MMDESKTVEEAFQDWWTGDESDEQITDVSKDRAFEIYRAGFRAGGFKPWTSFTQGQIQVMLKLFKEQTSEVQQTN